MGIDLKIGLELDKLSMNAAGLFGVSVERGNGGTRPSGGSGPSPASAWTRVVARRQMCIATP